MRKIYELTQTEMDKLTAEEIQATEADGIELRVIEVKDGWIKRGTRWVKENPVKTVGIVTGGGLALYGLARLALNAISGARTTTLYLEEDCDSDYEVIDDEDDTDETTE